MASTNHTVNLHENHNAQLISVAVVFAVLSLLSVIARLVSRRVRRHRITIDDALLVLAWIVALSESVMFAATTRFAKGGYHQAALEPHHVIALQKVFYATSFIQTTSLALSKISLLIMLYRIFEVVSSFRKACKILGGIVIAWWVGAFFAGAFICYPARHIWEPNVEGTCGNSEILDLVTPIPWALTDFAILVAPIPVIRKLQVNRTKRYRIYGAFMLGSITCIVTVVRYRSIFYSVEDFSYDIIPAAIWGLIEVHVTVMCPALMVTGPILTLMIGAVQPKWASFSSNLSWSRFPRNWKTESKTRASGKSEIEAMDDRLGVDRMLESGQRANSSFASDTVILEPLDRAQLRSGGAYFNLEG